MCRSPLPWEDADHQSPASSQDSTAGDAQRKHGFSYDGAAVPRVPVAQTHYGQGAGPAVKPASVAYAQARGLQPRAIGSTALHIGNNGSPAAGVNGAYGAGVSVRQLVLASDYDQVAASDEESEPEGTSDDTDVASGGLQQHPEVEGDEHDDMSGDISNGLSRKKASLKKFMSKLKRSSKEQHTVHVPQPARMA